MPHNPRRDRSREPLPVVLSDEQIAEAMERALALRKQTALYPDETTIQTLRAWDAMALTRNYRNHSWGYRMHHTGPDPWWWIGWVQQTPGGDISRQRVWEVWLDVNDGRIWLKFNRPLWDDDGPDP